MTTSGQRRRSCFCERASAWPQKAAQRSGDFLPVNGGLSKQPSHDIVLGRAVRDVEAIDWSKVIAMYRSVRALM